jgi:hypothetical protein
MKMIKMNMKMNTMIKREMRMMGIRKKATQDLHHHIQGCDTLCEEIAP